MPSKKNSFLSLIEKQRNKKKKPKFDGTFLEYLELVQKDPSIIKHAHKRLYESITSKGVTGMDDSDPRKRKILMMTILKHTPIFRKSFLDMKMLLLESCAFLSLPLSREKKVVKYCCLWVL